MKRAIYRIVVFLLSASMVIACGDNGLSSPEMQPEPEPQVRIDTVRLVFGGDLMQHIPQVRAAYKGGKYDYSATFEYIASIFCNADVAVLNLETTLTTRGDYSGYPSFASPIELADAIADIGVDIALLANNHCCDRAGRGIDTTIEQLTRCNIAHTGAFTSKEDYDANNILYFDSKGVRFAMVNYTYGTNGYPVPKGKFVNIIDNERIKRDISTINRDSVDCIIACMHWGIEYQRVPNEEQKSMAQFLKSLGVDVIIGSHPHVVQTYEVSSDGVVFYSLGNLVSNQRKRYTSGGLIAEVNIVRCDTVPGLCYSANAHPVHVIKPGYRIVPRSVGDTLKMSLESRQLYNLFMADTDRLLNR